MDHNDEEGVAGVKMPDTRYRLPEATRLILGNDHGLADPERWVRKQIKLGRFRAQKIGRSWFMREVDIEAAIESLDNVPICASPPDHPPPQPDSPIAPVAVPDILSGISARSRRRIIHHPRRW